jgi:hypothetical protein
MRSEIIIRGGLGNQLFSILEAYRLLLLEGGYIALNLSEYQSKKRLDRAFEIDQNLPQLLAPFGVKRGVAARIRLLLGKIYEKLANRQHRADRLPGDNPVDFSIFGVVRIFVGYYQNISSSEIDRSALEKMKIFFSEYGLQHSINRLAIHVRRGDYLLPKHKIHGLVEIHDLCLEAKRALAIRKFDGLTIFTDSPELLDMSEFESLNADILVDIGGTPYDVLKRMSMHSGIIASNSSFSLWAGLLGCPKYFSLPQYWMPGVESSRLGLDWVRRYPCTL